MDKLLAALVIAIVALMIIAPVLIVGALVHAYVLVCLWDWFILTTFTGLPSIGMAQAYGICLVVGFFRSAKLEKDLVVVRPGGNARSPEYEIKDSANVMTIMGRVAFHLVLGPALVLGIGKIVHMWFIAG